MGACGKVDQVLDLISKGLGFDSIHAGNVKKSSKLIPSCVCPQAVMGTLWSETCWVVLSSGAELPPEERHATNVCSSS